MISKSRVTRYATIAVLCVSMTVWAAQRDLNKTEVFPSEAGKVLMTDVANLDLRVQNSDVDRIEADVELHIGGTGEEKAKRWIENHTPEFSDSEDSLKVTVEPAKSGFLGFGRLSAKARLAFRVPGEINPDLTTSTGNIQVRGDFPNAQPLRLRSLAGDITLIGATRSLHINGGEGEIQIEVFRPLDEFFARSSSGSINLTGGAREARAGTGSGAIRLENISGNVEASTSNGRVTVIWDRIGEDAQVRIRSASGRVILQLPGNTRPQGRLSTTTGNVRSEFPGTVTADGGTLQLSGDGPTFDVETASGEIQLTIREVWN